MKKFFAVLLLAALCGCSTPMMKATPFYEFGKKERSDEKAPPPETRTNLWPLAYQRDDYLSVLWPLFDKSNEHLAVRPFFSEYKQDATHTLYNFLWPLGQVDQKSGDNYIFPAFWSNGCFDTTKAGTHFVIFPLYWQFNHPFGGDRGDHSLFPLWIYENETGDKYSLDLLWPIFQRDQSDGDNRFLPFFWSDGFWKKEKFDTHFVGFPLYWHFDHPFAENGTGTNSLFPLWIYDNQPGEYYSFDYLWPLGRIANERYEKGSRFWPLYSYYRNFYETNPSTSGSILWPIASWENTAKTARSSFFPFWHYDRNERSTHLLTIPYSYGKDAADKWDWSAVVPFYYRDREGERSRFVTLLGGTERDENGNSWMVWPLITGRFEQGDGGSFLGLGGIFYYDWDAKGTSHHVLPLYRWNGRDDSLYSLLAARWHRADGTSTTLITPALTWWNDREKRTDLYMLLGLAKASWGEQPGSSWLAPLFYSDKNRDGSRTFLSPLFMTGRSGSQNWNSVFPLYFRARATETGEPEKELGSTFATALFGWTTKQGKLDYAYYATPLIGSTHGDTSGAYVFPFFMHFNFKEPQGAVKKAVVTKKMSTLFPLYVYVEEELNSFFPSKDQKALRESSENKSLLLLLVIWNHSELRQKMNPVQPNAPAIPPTAKAIIRETNSGFFPLWVSRTKVIEAQKKERSSSHFLLFLYDHKTKKSPEYSYSMHRVIWRLYHYEKLNGDTTTDVFPFITSDSRKDGSSVFSFGKKVYRYERAADGSKKVYLFWIPIVSTESK